MASANRVDGNDVKVILGVRSKRWHGIEESSYATNLGIFLIRIFWLVLNYKIDNVFGADVVRPGEANRSRSDIRYPHIRWRPW